MTTGRSCSGHGRRRPAEAAEARPLGSASRSARCCPAAAAAAGPRRTARSPPRGRASAITTCARRGSCSSTCSPSSSAVHADVGGAGDHVRQPEPVQLLGRESTRQQPDSAAGTRCGPARSRRAPRRRARSTGRGRERLEQQPDLAAAALAAVLVRWRAVESASAMLSAARTAPDPIISRARATAGRLQVAAADAAPACARGRPPSCAPASRGACPRTSVTVTSTPDCAVRPAAAAAAVSQSNSDPSSVAARADSCRGRLLPWPPRPPRTRPSGVDGRPRLDAASRPDRTHRPPGAAPRATLNASISGGSPTAFEP